MIKHIFLLVCLIALLTTSAFSDNWSFTISGDDTADCDDADLWSTSSTTLRGDTATTMWIGDNSGERRGWVKFNNLNDSLDVYGGVVDSVCLVMALGTGELLIDTTGTDDTLRLWASPARKVPVEADVCWDTCKSTQAWTTAGAKNVTDAYQRSLDTAGPIVFGSYSPYDTVHIWIDPLSLLVSDNGWIIQPKYTSDGNCQIVFVTSEDGSSTGPALIVYGHTVTPLTATEDSIGYSYNDAGVVTGAFSTTETTGRFGEDVGGALYKNAFRFCNIPLDSTAVVDSAFLLFYSGGLGSGMDNRSFRFYGVDLGHADPWTDYAHYDSVYTYHRTTASVLWTYAAISWGATWNKSPNVKTIITEIIGTSGWKAGMPLGFITGAGSAMPSNNYDVYKTHDGAPSQAPRLKIYVTYPATGLKRAIIINGG